ncbi:MAG: hypothetical protein HY033_13420 [Ignavibacteriae bacterium]|nr:hypothetical protein [Ignavibacteriota bacterium]
MPTLNKTQENKLTMYEAVLSLMGSNGTVVTGVPALKEAKDSFDATVQQIKVKGRERHEATAGKTATKQQAEDALVASLMEIASALYSFAWKAGRNDVKEIADVTETKLRRMRDTELESRAKSIHEKATADASGLANYNITAEKISNLQGRIADFGSALGERESSAAGRTGLTTTLTTLFDQADEILAEDLDRLMETVRDANNDFYNTYFSARVIKDTGIRHKKAEPAPPPTPPSS